MATRKLIFSCVISAAALLAACATAGKFRPPVFVSASDPALRYEGRFDTAVATAPVIIWQGSRVTAEFEGDRLALLFGAARGQVFFDVAVDGTNSVIRVQPGEPFRAEWPGRLGAGRHRLEIFKRSEASAGTAAFLGLELAPGAGARRPPEPAYTTTMLFLGDSITAGACNEDGAADQWEDRSTHNSARSYAALTAAAFGADHRNISVSGMGVSAGYVPVKAGQAWDRLYPRADSPRADLAGWTPRLVFVNYGENDYSFTRGKKEPFPADFAGGYEALVKAVRAAYPAAKIVLLRGGMYGGAQGKELKEAWEKAAAVLEASDPGITHFVFRHWTENHPRVADDRALAAELTAWLRQSGLIAR